MRIPNANIPAQASRIPTTLPSPPASKSLERRQLLEPADTYTRDGRQGSPQIIDAEYVEFYSPSTQVSTKERQNLDLSLEAAAGDRTTAKAASGGNAAINSYRAVSADPPPPPGTFINIFA